MRGLTSTLILVVVLAGLGGYIYFVESKRPARRPRRRVGDEGKGLHRRSRQDQRAPHHLPGPDVAAEEGRRRLEADRADADRRRSAGGHRRGARHRPTSRSSASSTRTPPTSRSSAWPKPPITVAFKAEGGTSGIAEARRQDRDAGRHLRDQGRREARVPGLGVPGNQLQPEAVRPARQEDPQVRARQGRLARAGRRAPTRSSWRAPAASGRS